MEAGGDLGFGGFGCEADGLAYADVELAGAEPAAAAGFHFAQAAEGDRQNGGVGLADEEPDAGAERRELAGGGAGAFRKNEDVIAAVEGLAGVGEAALEVAQAGEREDVEERSDEQPCEGAEGIRSGS